MAGVKISELPAATVPLAGTELLAVVQGGTTKQASANAVSDTVSSSILADFAASDGSSLVGFLQSDAGAVATTVQSKLRETPSLKDFGAVGNGTTDDSAAITAANNAATQINVSRGIYNGASISSTTLTGPYVGYGQIKDSAGNNRGKFFSAIKSRPSVIGNQDSLETAFNGDLSKLLFPIEHRITGVATLGQPATGYLYTPEASALYLYSYNASGWNQSTNSNNGRTGATAMRVLAYQAGQGDSVCYNGSTYVTSTRAGSTDVLANPASVLFNGDQGAGVDGAYLNAYETIQLDNGYDVAAAGIVNNFVRTNATGAKSAFWFGYRAQNTGTQPIDNIISATGKAQVGLDFAMSGLDFGTNKAAISLKANDRIYFNNAATASGNLRADIRTTAFNGDYLTYSSVNSAFLFVGLGSAQLAITPVASAVNYTDIRGAVTGAIPGLFAQGSDTNVSMGYRAKGDGYHFFYNAGGSTLQALIGGGGFLGIRDGVPAPGALANMAVLYVDSADGDLKVVFSDGTVKTIVVDT